MLSIIVMSFFRRAIDSCSPPFVKKSELNPGIMPCEEKQSAISSMQKQFIFLFWHYLMLCCEVLFVTLQILFSLKPLLDVYK